MPLLQFDEFRALRQRQKHDNSEIDDSSRVRVQPPSVNADKAGYFFESFEVQVITLCLIIFDVAAAVVNLFLSCGTFDESLIIRILSKILESFTGFTIFFFILELAALVFAFRLSFFTHAGNLLDTAVVLTCAIWEINGQSHTIRLLGVFRGWRLLRLINVMIAKKDQEMDQCTEQWQADQQLLEEAKIEIARLQDSAHREMESKKRIEAMLKSYKDEVETLNEALRIAALDIANVAGDQLLSDEEQEVDERGRETGTQQLATTKFVVSEDGSFSRT